jgi:hypothetical protein
MRLAQFQLWPDQRIGQAQEWAQKLAHDAP